MPRRSSRPSGGRRPAPSRASARPAARSASTRSRPSPPPAQTRAKSTAPASQKSAAAPPPVAAQPQQGSAMGGFMANVASTGLGVMAGRAMDRTFFGGSGSASEPISEPINAVDPASSEYSTEEPLPDTVCAREMLEFKKCMERNGSDIGACQWNIDILSACQRQQQDLGFANASRL
ncbi:unnamed protein product [Agarophyton chilense]|eukprot:gb/GEZJ01000420.1/.p1 GENE.gb/GEZJ01000420.1/~~gb/GEZJ01000420.1/.p1  ORF type:complete len:177 (-),score=20.29 gb/GEZJ01000420.1/:2184-2714(-)